MTRDDSKVGRSQARNPATTTALSRPQRRGAADFGQTSAVARLSLFAASMSLCAVGTTGCFDAPPEYSVPERVPPILDEAGATPPITSLYAPEGSRFDLSMPFRVSATEAEVQAIFIVDSKSGAEVQLCPNFRAPGDTRLECRDAWTIVSPGCHTITVRASYQGNFDDGFVPKDPSLATEATWFASLEDPEDLDPVDCFPGAPAP